MSSNIKETENYEFVIFEKNVFKNDIKKALDIVKNYIIEHKLIITGSMAIDLALKHKNSSLFGAKCLPDYDFYSTDFHNDAYKIGQLLCKANLKNVDVINAFHATTMRVRVNFEAVADLTYIPNNIHNKIPTIKHHDGRIFEHPHYKMINMHLALSYPYANSPKDAILQRFIKDMKRYDILYEHYPITDIFKPIKNIKMVNITLPFNVLKNECISGFAALYYWNSKYQNFISSTEEKTYKNNISFKIPKSVSMTILSDNPKYFKEKMKTLSKKEKNKLSNETYYSSILDNIHSRYVYKYKSNNYEIIDNRGFLVSAHKINIGRYMINHTSAAKNKSKGTKPKETIYVANLQCVMQEFLAYYFLIDMKSEEIKNIYLWGYIQAFNLIKNASDNENKLPLSDIKYFFPTGETYGEYNINKADIYRQSGYLSYIGEKKPDKIRNRPYNQYLSIDNDCKLEDKIKKFDLHKSWLFDINGLKRDDIQIGLNELIIE